MKSLLDSIWETEDTDVIITPFSGGETINISCGGPKPPVPGDDTIGGPICKW